MFKEEVLEKVFVYPEKDGFNNVVRKINWKIVTEGDANDPTTHMVSLVETDLDTTTLSPETFILIEEFTQTELLNRAIKAQGGQAYIDSIRAIHDEYVKDKLLKKSLSEYDFSNNPT